MPDIDIDIDIDSGIAASASPQDAFAVAEAVAEERGLPLESLLSRERQPLAVAARREVFLRLYTAGWSSTRIGRTFGFDHSTVLYAIQRAKRPSMGEEAVDLRGEIDDLRRRIEVLEAAVSKEAAKDLSGST